MGLFDQIANNLIIGAATGSGTTSGAIEYDINSALNSKINGAMNSAFGGAKRNVFTNLAQSVVSRMINNTFPSNLSNSKQFNAIDQNKQLGRQLLNYGNSNTIPESFGDGVGATASFGDWDNPVFGGVSHSRAVEMWNEHRTTKLVKKNLFLIELSSQLTGDESHIIHMFATAVEYPTINVTSEKAKIGTANADLIQSSEATTLSITTYDTQDGVLKTWFKNHALASAPTDGTAGVPSDYGIRIKIVHGVIDDGQQGYEDKGWFRAETFNNSLSRAEDSLEEITMQFSQLDTFFGW